MYQSVRYSFSFCLKYNKKGTLARLGIASGTTLLGYLLIQAQGNMLNSVQHSKGNMRLLLIPILLLIGLRFVDQILNRSLAFTQATWAQVLRYANSQQLNNHRASLDIACIKSEKYDNLSKQISELPMGWNVRVSFAEQVFEIFSTSLSFLLFGISLLWYKPLYAGILLLAAIPKVFSEFNIVSMWWKLYESNVPLNKLKAVLESPYRGEVGYTQADMFNQWKPLEALILQNNDEQLTKQVHARGIVAKKKTKTGILALCASAFVLCHAVWMTVKTGSGIGTLSVVLSSAAMFQGNLNSIMMMVAEQWNSAKAVILIEKDFLGLRPVIQTLDPIFPDFKNPNIRFDRVSFAYPNSGKKVLHEVSFEIKSGSKVAIVGASGNGKSTIASLLMRHYDPTSGAVYADDINLQNIQPEIWNTFATSLMQDYRIHERLIAEELASSKLDESINMEKVIEASKFASFHQVVEEDELGYKQQIGEDFGGRDFSGGERQRLALARVMYRGTPVLILDEPDARLDPESAEAIMQRVYALKHVTVIIITHHVSRALECDEVIVMGKGKVLEHGNPHELLQSAGAYARMYAADKKKLNSNKEAEA